MSSDQPIIDELRQLANPDKALVLQRFFKTGTGEYGEGDRFLGIPVPAQRIVAKTYRSADLSAIESLLHSPIHEHRLTALLILTYQFPKASPAQQKVLYEFYLNNTGSINNWDLVDSSAEYIVGAYLANKDKKPLYRLAHSLLLWERRIAMIACFHFIKHRSFDDALNIAELLLHDSHDLMHKAVGWMLREIGKRDINVLYDFLQQHYRVMPRTMLRYAIEKLSPRERQAYLRGTF